MLLTLSNWNKMYFKTLPAQRELTLTMGSPAKARRIPVEIFDASQPAQVTGKGVMNIRSGHTKEYITNHLRGESVNSLGFRIMGKTRNLLVNFDLARSLRDIILEILIGLLNWPRTLACFVRASLRASKH